MRYLILTILFCGLALGQEGYVVQLDVPDAVQARETWDQLQTAKANWEAVRKHMARKYLVVKPDDPEASGEHYTDESILGTSNSASFPTTDGINISAQSGCLGADVKGIVSMVDCSTGKPIVEREPIAEETAKREAEKVEQEKRDQDYRNAYAHELRQRRGFKSGCSNCLPEFDFSHDFKYLVPKKAEQKVTWPSWWSSVPTESH